MPMRASIVIASLLVAGGSVGWAAAQAAGERIDATEGSLFLLGPTSLSTLDPESLDSLAWPEPPQADPELDPEVAAAEESAPFPDQPPGTGAAAIDADIWVRARQGFNLADHSDHPRVQQHIDWHRCNHDFLQRVTARAEPFLHFILERIEAQGLPSELLLLPVIESAYLPYAYSHGRAAGLWQFIPSTGRLYGLKQNWWYDGRRDVLASTDAALRYLARLHKTFDGDWLLALAAYNAGQGNVRKAIRRNQRKGKPTDFWHLKLPTETRHYVPKLLAVAAIVQDPELYGIDLWPVPDEPYLTVVKFDSQIDMAIAAELAGLELEELYLLNPAFNRWATDPKGPHRLLLPATSAEPFRTGLASLPRKQRVTWVRHEIRSGESLGTIARRYGTTISVLKRSNQLRGTMIRAGDHLLVPTSSRSKTAYSLSASERRVATQSRPQGARKHLHVVRSGDTFWDLAQRYQVSVRQLARWNGMAPGDILRPGDRLVVWLPAASGAALSLPDFSHPLGDQTLRKVRYSVRKGDSLYRIAQRFSVGIDDIQRWNQLSREHVLRPGQRLTLFVDVTRYEG
ncbi:MAG: LysM peptidoglycan-binding domain-containing protein [Chromatiales bacterium]